MKELPYEKLDAAYAAWRKEEDRLEGKAAPKDVRKFSVKFPASQELEVIIHAEDEKMALVLARYLWHGAVMVPNPEICSK